MRDIVKTTGFSLAKGKELIGDDYFSVKIFDDILVAIICDGVGSALKGQEAAKRVTNYIINNFKNRPSSWSIEKSIKNFITSINSILYQESNDEYNRAELITTIALIVIYDNRLYGANVGDSRIYLFRNNNFIQLSNDHIEEGLDGVLSEAIGIKEDVDLYYFENNIDKNDIILICSDGLYNILDDNELIKYLPFGANFLVKQASKKVNDDLPDDTTAVCIEILEKNQKQFLKQQKLKIEDVKINEVIDGYKLVNKFNDRTFIAIKKGKEYIIKFAPIEANFDEKILDLFVREVWNAKRLKAGFFPKAVVPKNRTHRYYIMQYLKGQTLKDYIKKRPLHIDDTINLAKTLIKMGMYLLKYDLIHGDIKPENIIVLKRDDKLIFKIIDFGSINEIYSDISKAGTPSYLAPERFKGYPNNESSEIFAIGVVLFESLTQKFPYGEIEPFSNPTFKTPKRLISLNKKIPLWLESIILRAISVDKDNRYQHFSEILYELENPTKVKPFFDKNKPLIEREPLKAYKIGFFVSLVVNIILFYLILK